MVSKYTMTMIKGNHNCVDITTNTSSPKRSKTPANMPAAKGSGTNELLVPVKLDLDFDRAFASERVGAYERLLLDAIAGRLNLFVRSDEQEEAWRWVEPVLDAWDRERKSGGEGPRGYAAGSWGPSGAFALIERSERAWSD